MSAKKTSNTGIMMFTKKTLKKSLRQNVLLKIILTDMNKRKVHKTMIIPDIELIHRKLNHSLSYTTGWVHFASIKRE